MNKRNKNYRNNYYNDQDNYNKEDDNNKENPYIYKNDYNNDGNYNNYNYYGNRNNNYGYNNYRNNRNYNNNDHYYNKEEGGHEYSQSYHVQDDKKEVEYIKEEQTEIKKEEVTEYDNKRRFKKKKDGEEEKVEILERPDNALSYKEYKEIQMKKKEQLGQDRPKVQINNNSDLQFRNRLEDEIVTNNKKKQLKTKPVKVNREEFELNKIVSEKLSIRNEVEEIKEYKKPERPAYNNDSRQFNNNRNYNNRTYRQDNKVNLTNFRRKCLELMSSQN